MLPAGQLAEHLSIAEMQSHSVRHAGVGAGVGVRGAPPTGRFGPLQENLGFENTQRMSLDHRGV